MNISLPEGVLLCVCMRIYEYFNIVFLVLQYDFRIYHRVKYYYYAVLWTVYASSDQVR
jgi:hypothetical protein